jgi:hypothetical protein
LWWVDVVVDGGGGVALGELGDRRSVPSGTIWWEIFVFWDFARCKVMAKWSKSYDVLV